MIKEVEGNLLTYPGLQVIGHQTNCLGVMGGGIAKQIKAANPNLFKVYQNYCKENDKKALGTVQFIPADNSDQIVANLFGEYSFCESIAPHEEGGKPRHTDYDALKTCLTIFHSWAKEKGIQTLGIPYKLGCGLAGGNWDGVVYPMIKDEFEEDDSITLYIVKYV